MRQLNLSVGVAYGTNIQQAVTVVRDILNHNPRVLKDPDPVVGVTLLGDSSVTIAIKPWVSLADYGLAVAEINCAILEQFHSNQISIPFPQREVRVINGSAATAVS